MTRPPFRCPHGRDDQQRPRPRFAPAPSGRAGLGGSADYRSGSKSRSRAATTGLPRDSPISGSAASSTVGRSGRIGRRPCFGAVAGVVDVLAGDPIRRDLQAHRATARVAEQPPASTPVSLPERTIWESAAAVSAATPDQLWKSSPAAVRCRSRRAFGTPGRAAVERSGFATFVVVISLEGEPRPRAAPRPRREPSLVRSGPWCCRGSASLSPQGSFRVGIVGSQCERLARTASRWDASRSGGITKVWLLAMSSGSRGWSSSIIVIAAPVPSARCGMRSGRTYASDASASQSLSASCAVV